MVSIKNAFKSGNKYAVGIAWNYNDPDPQLDRWFMAGGYEQTLDFDKNPFDHLWPYKGMVRGNYDSNGKLVANFGDPGYAEDGSNGQVLVPQPGCFYRRWRDTAKERTIMAVSPWPLNGFKWHPSAIDNSGKRISGARVGAFEAGLQVVADDSFYEDPYCSSLSAAIDDATDTIPVRDLSVFEDSGNAWIATGATQEKITYTGRSASSGAGNLTGATRGVDETPAGAHGVGVIIAPQADSTPPTISSGHSSYRMISCAGYKPKSNQNLPDFRLFAPQTGSRYRVMRYVDHALLQMLLYIEYAHLDSQASLGQGIVSKASGSPANNADPTDGSHGAWAYSLTDHSYGVTTDGLHAVVYRGIENPWGNIWKWGDNCIVDDTGHYLGIGVEPSDTKVGYTHYPVAPNALLGNIQDIFHEIDHGFFGSAVSGTNYTIYFCGRYYYTSGTRASLLSSSWHAGAIAGVGTLDLAYAPSHRSRAVGARLLVL